ncbi:MAG: hypothetical protein ABJL55_17960 [Roseibium sp.]
MSLFRDAVEALQLRGNNFRRQPELPPENCLCGEFHSPSGLSEPDFGAKRTSSPLIGVEWSLMVMTDLEFSSWGNPCQFPLQLPDLVGPITASIEHLDGYKIELIQAC